MNSILSKVYGKVNFILSRVIVYGEFHIAQGKPYRSEEGCIGPVYGLYESINVTSLTPTLFGLSILSSLLL